MLTVSSLLVLIQSITGTMPDITYYPQKRYIEKNLAPESSLTKADFAALALAQRRAVETGVLTPELAKQMIPMAITEGWSANHGVREDLMLYASPQNIERFKKMGLTIAQEHEVLSAANGTSFTMGRSSMMNDQATPSLMERIKGKLSRGVIELLDHVEQSTRERGKEPTPVQSEWDKLVKLHRDEAHPSVIQEQADRFEQIRDGVLDARARMPAPKDDTPADLLITERKGDKYLVLNSQWTMHERPNERSEVRAARIMAAVLSEKASLKDVKSPDDAIKRYNGRGKSVEYLHGDVVPADVDVYLSKVKEAGELLKHPKNAPLSEYLNQVGALQ
jgi:hypothetical protein